MLRFENVSFSYGEKNILSGFSFEAKDSEATALLGASGLGKTTVQMLASGLYEPKSGKITAYSGKRASFLFQENRLLPWCTALQNLTVPGVSEERAREYLRKVGLAGEENEFPGALSGGMQRRLSLARALSFGGDIFYLDEPLQGLDIKTSGEILALLKTELAGKSTLLITHSPAEAFALCDRIVLVGKRPLEILADVPKERFRDEEELKQFLASY